MSPSWNPVQIEREEFERADEPMGTKEKFWLELPDDDRLWLFKLACERDGVVPDPPLTSTNTLTDP